MSRRTNIPGAEVEGLNTEKKRGGKRIKLNALVALTGVQAKQIQRIADSGYMERGDRGGYDLTQSVQGIVRYYAEQVGGGSAELKQLKLRQQRAETERVEGELRKDAGDVKMLVGAWEDWRAEVIKGIAGLRLGASTEKAIFAEMDKAQEVALEHLRRDED